MKDNAVYWKTRNGRLISVDDMDINHLRNVLKMIKCEFCNHIETDSSMNSYDDRYYHDNVIPNKKCKKCGKSTISEKGNVDKTPTKYPEGFQV